jgi:hypothetical protein
VKRKRILVTAEMAQDMADMYEAGKTISAITNKYGCSDGVVMGWLSKKGINPRQRQAEELPPIPPDTRCLTGLLCGDPLPGRSALDKMKQERSNGLG